MLSAIAGIICSGEIALSVSSSDFFFENTKIIFPSTFNTVSLPSTLFAINFDSSGNK